MSNFALQCELGSAKTVWLLATSDKPLTVDELHERVESDVSRSNVCNTLTVLWRSGLLVRRRRHANEKYAPSPYEYALAPRDNE